jgi:hypothetical protein
VYQTPLQRLSILNWQDNVPPLSQALPTTNDTVYAIAPLFHKNIVDKQQQ